MINEQYPSKLLEHAVQELSRLPGVGRKTALRFALYLLKQDNQIVEEFSKSLLTLRNDVKHCKVCHNISDTDNIPFGNAAGCILYLLLDFIYRKQTQ